MPICNRASGSPSPLRLLSQTGLNLNQKYHLKVTGNPFCNVFSNPYAKVKWRFPRQVLPLTRMFQATFAGMGCFT
jgi:hypothetical protein